MKKRAELTALISYFTSLTVESGILAVLSFVAVPTLVESIVATVESFVSVVADPEPHAVIVNVTITANKNVIFLIIIKYKKKN